MHLRPSFFNTKWKLRGLWALPVLLLSALAILYITLLIQVGQVTVTLGNLLAQPLLILLNLLPILTVLVLLWAATNNPFLAASLTSIIFHLMSLVNRIKIEARYDPFLPSDFTLLGEAMTATGEYKLDLHVPIIIGIVLFALALGFFAWKCRFEKPKALVRIVAAVLVPALLVGGLFTLYPDKNVYSKLCRKAEGVSEYNVPTVFDGLGFPYCFLHNINLYPVYRPESYSVREARAWAEQPATNDTQPKVNVIFVQAEAFSDIMRDEAFGWDFAENPLLLYDLVADGPQAISGHIIVSNYGAGTANTEFDIVTGMPTTMIAEGNTSAFRVVHRKTPSLERVLMAHGYEDYFMHPGKRWFYNRLNVYDYFGFTRQMYDDEFDSSLKKGNYISDKAFGDRLMQIMTDHAARSEAPLALFSVTIQNHQAYPYSKYPFQVAAAKFSREVSDETMETISVYAEGIRDTSKLLMDLTTFFDAQEDPTVVVFWGDHLPALGKNFSVYHDLGMDIGYETTLQGTLNTYMTPFTVWGNRAFCEDYDMAQVRQALGLGSDPVISDFYLGELVYEILGLQGADPYFDFLSELRRALPVIRPGCYMQADGTLISELSPEQSALVEKLHNWEYYRIMDERVK